MPVIRAEVAKRHDELAAGLMGRKRLSENSGMLFIFGSKKPLSFWMASTYIPLQIAFIREDGIIGQIENMVPLSTKAVRSLEPCMYALEVNDGWFERNNVKVGAKVAVPFLGLGQELPPDQQGQQEPPMTIEQSYKDILKAVDSSGAKVLVEYLYLHVPLNVGPMLLLSVMMLITGLQFIIFGFIVEIQIRTYYNSGVETDYTIREIIN